jgi:hypothetical protein
MANNYSQVTVSPDLPAALFSAAELQSLNTACGLTSERNGDDLYFYAEECFWERNEDEDGLVIDCLALLQEKLRQLDPATYPCITINGAATCSKMRPDEFGGFAYFITRDDLGSISTWQWLDEQMRSSNPQPSEAA